MRNPRSREGENFPRSPGQQEAEQMFHQEDLLGGLCWLLGAVLTATLSSRAGCTLHTSTHEGLRVVRQMVAVSILSIVSHLSISCTETWWTLSKLIQML